MWHSNQAIAFGACLSIVLVPAVCVSSRGCDMCITGCDVRLTCPPDKRVRRRIQLSAPDNPPIVVI